MVIEPIMAGAVATDTERSPMNAVSAAGAAQAAMDNKAASSRIKTPRIRSGLIESFPIIESSFLFLISWLPLDLVGGFGGGVSVGCELRRLFRLTLA